MIEEPSQPATLWVQPPSDGLHTRHYRGLPPQVTGGVDIRHFYPPARLVLARPEGGGGWLLDRYAGDGAFAGNTFHASWTEAVDQIQFEYVSNLAFEPIPPNADDPRLYAQQLATQA
jgi:hypothetical protein